MIQIKQTGKAYTLVPDSFIDRHLPEAPGDFVKVYIYLLSLTHRQAVEVSLAALAAFFACGTDDIAEALSYWEERGLAKIGRVGGEIAKIELMPDAKSNVNSRSLSATRADSLKADYAEVRQMLFACEQMLGRTLNLNESNKLLYFYDELKFSDQLVEYCVEYCVEKGKTDIRYIEKVALEWHKAKVKTVEDAKIQSGVWGKKYFAVLKAFGIANRNPIPEEIRMIDLWTKDYGFSMEVITEAAARTVSQTGKQSFKYADGILKSWKEAGAKTMSDIEKLDKAYKEKAAASAGNTAGKAGAAGNAGGKAGNADGLKSGGKNDFHNFKQHDYNFDEIERILDNQ